MIEARSVGSPVRRSVDVELEVGTVLGLLKQLAGLFLKVFVDSRSLVVKQSVFKIGRCLHLTNGRGGLSMTPSDEEIFCGDADKTLYLRLHAGLANQMIRRPVCGLGRSIGPDQANVAAILRRVCLLGRIGSDYIEIVPRCPSSNHSPETWVGGQTDIPIFLPLFSLAVLDPSKDAAADHPRPLHRPKAIASFASAYLHPWHIYHHGRLAFQPCK